MWPDGGIFTTFWSFFLGVGTGDRKSYCVRNNQPETLAACLLHQPPHNCKWEALVSTPLEHSNLLDLAVESHCDLSQTINGRCSPATTVIWCLWTSLFMHSAALNAFTPHCYWNFTQAQMQLNSTFHWSSWLKQLAAKDLSLSNISKGLSKNGWMDGWMQGWIEWWMTMSSTSSSPLSSSLSLFH